jgi:hypothetical protein
MRRIVDQMSKPLDDAGHLDSVAGFQSRCSAREGAAMGLSS